MKSLKHTKIYLRSDTNDMLEGEVSTSMGLFYGIVCFVTPQLHLTLEARKHSTTKLPLICTEANLMEQVETSVMRLFVTVCANNPKLPA